MCWTATARNVPNRSIACLAMVEKNCSQTKILNMRNNCTNCSKSSIRKIWRTYPAWSYSQECLTSSGSMR